MPDILKEISRKEKGLVLVTGPTGSGKSTTLAAMINLINEELDGHILTIEDPIEFVQYLVLKCNVSELLGLVETLKTLQLNTCCT